MATVMAEKTRLATPQERPEADVLIYDGDCRFCRAQVERIASWDNSGRLAFLSLHEPEVYRRYPELTHDYLMTTVVLVDRNGKRHAGAAAMRYLSRHLPKLWPLMPLMHIPFSLPVWQWLYRQVAKRRYKIAGKMSDCDNGACAVHFK